MKVVCPGCHSVYEVADDAAAVPGAAVCPRCRGDVQMGRQASAGALDPDMDYGHTMVLFMPLPAQQDEQARQVKEALKGAHEHMPEGGRFVLKALDGDDAGRRYVLEKTRTVLGRSSADITINDPEVSRRHASVSLYGDRVVIQDLKSTNGTFVNRVGVRIAFLHDGDVIQVGGTSFEFSAR